MKLLLLFVLVINTLYPFGIRHFLLPKDGDKAEKSLITDMQNAKEKIDVAMFMVTNKKLANALKERAQKGKITIRLIADKSYDLSHKNSKLAKLLGLKNLSVYHSKGLQKNKKNKYGILHAKLVIIDDYITYIGSTNWTKSAFHYNREILMKITDQATTELYQNYFNDIQKHATPYKIK